MKNTLIIIILFSCLIEGYSQKEDFVWLLGYGNNPNSTITGGSRIDFNTEPPTITLEHRPINFFLSDASICNESGNLLFYTNGVTVGDANNEVMENGDSLGLSEIHLSFGIGSPSGPPLQQGAIILKIPEHDSLYMILHMELSEDIDDLVPTLNGIFRCFYSIVSIRPDGTMGRVVEKNVLLLEDIFDEGRIKSVKHANGVDWWILISKRETNIYYTLRLGENGIEENFTQSIGDSTISGSGQAVFSPDGRKYARNGVRRLSEPGQIDIYDFDRCNGLLTNPTHIVIDTTEEGNVDLALGGVVFSPDSKLLYLTGREKVVQYDMEVEDITLSGDTVAWLDDFRDTLFNFPTPFGVTQLAPNDKIYMATTTNTKHLHVIHDPNIRGVGCNVEQHAIELPRLNDRSIPNHPNYRLKALIGSPCDTIRPIAAFTYDMPPNTAFTDQSARTPTQWEWTFGDGNSSNTQNPNHTYTESGTYEVCLIATNEAGSDTTCQEVVVVITDVDDLESVAFTVFPNPTRGELTVVLPDTESRNWRLVNVLGQSMKVGIFNQTTESLNWSDLGSGMYWLEVDGLGVKKLVLVE